MPDRSTTIAKTLRRRMTDTERRLWTQLRARRLACGKFKRQQPIGPYIVDFVCFHAQLVVEVDGGQHQGNETDQARDAWLQEHGFRVLRFWDNKVLAELPAVLEKIAAALSPSPPPLSRKGRGGQPPAF
jgi:very-short-patch-repair endonuclease